MKLLTFNIWNVPGTADRQARMAALEQVLATRGSEWDAVLLQELWPWGERRRFDRAWTGEARDGERPFERPRNWVMAPLRLLGLPAVFDTGLRTLTRSAPHEVRRMVYRGPDSGRDLERWVRKGALAVLVDMPGTAGGTVWLVNTHLVAGIKGATRNRERRVQLAQLRAWMDNTLTGAPIVLAGDLNMGPPLEGSHAASDEPGFWDEMLAGPLNGFRPYGPDLETATWTGTTNPYVAADRECEHARLDHVLAGPGLQVWASRVLFADPLVATPEGERPLSDHYAVEARIMTG